MEKPILSVIIISYNQEKFLEQAIKSVINQKTEYKYEILLADDCSPDNSKLILEKYHKKYPKIIRIIPRKHNLGGTANSFNACSKAKGKYITVLEGDDYWCNNIKIQTQIDFLERNPDYVGVSHLQLGIDENNITLAHFPLWIKKECDISAEDFINEKSFSCTTCIYKNLYLNNQNKHELKELFSFSNVVGDYQLCLYLLTQGKIKVFPDPMMVYRIQKNGNNYNSKHKLNYICFEHLYITSKLDNFFENRLDFSQKYLRFYTIGVSYSIIKKDFTYIKRLLSNVPKNKKLMVISLYPFKSLEILFELIRRRNLERKFNNE
jgi:glycosyltransferase involved in cell wall biosynthesis